MASYTGGSKAASRVQALEEERRNQKEDIERRKEQIVALSSNSLNKAANNNFASRSEAADEILKHGNVGLVTHEDFKKRRKYLESCATEEKHKKEHEIKPVEPVVRQKRSQRAKVAVLSFGDDSDDSEDETEASPSNKKRSSTGNVESGMAVNREKSKATSNKRRKLGKNPNVDTSFLPDRERDLAQQAEREKLKQDWLKKQEQIKNEIVRITYSFWDGSGHRKFIKCKKGTTIAHFLSMVQTQVKQLRNGHSDSLMFIKEDLIIPHHYSFYDLIVSKARGKSGPLFNFDVVEDVRVLADASKEKEDAHAGKVVERRWYERNRHIFPASRWEVYDPTKRFSKYTIH